jgi:hypothetical protein
VGRADRGEATARRGSWQGRDCWQVDYRDLRGTSYRYYVDPERGPSVIRLEVSWDDAGRHFVDAVETDLAVFGPTRAWFPRSCVYVRTQDGRHVEKEIVDVEVVALNEPLAADAFKLAGMNIPPDTLIAGLHDPRGLLFWDGKEIVPESALPGDEYASGPATRRWLLLANAVFFAGVAAFLLWRYRLQRRLT